MEIGILVNQSQVLSPRMIQQMEVLQMGAQELEQYLEEMVQENPVLEVEDHREEPDDFCRKLDWLSQFDRQNRSYTRPEQEERDPFYSAAATDEEESLHFFLRSQVRMELLSPEKAVLLDFLMQSLDSNGWLEENTTDLMVRFGLSEQVVTDMINLLQSLSPAGVGGRGLQECLMLQLERQGERGLAMEIIQNHLEAMSKDHFNAIAKATGASRVAVQAACQRIRTLNPRPGAPFARRGVVTYITPDVIVEVVDGRPQILQQGDREFTIQLNGYYSKLWKETTDLTVREYLGEKIRQAQWVIQSVSQRKSMLMRCAECILQRQKDFFLQGRGHLHPMLLSDVAAELGVHESTISRTIREKYLQCSYGVFKLSDFFSHSCSTTGSPEVSVDRVKAAMLQLIHGENRRKPLSDQKLQEQLEKQGIVLSRRTVAKYRDELGIPSSAGRKQFE